MACANIMLNCYAFNETFTRITTKAYLIFQVLNLHLNERLFLVGESFSMADVAVACCLLPLYQRVLESDER